MGVWSSVFPWGGEEVEEGGWLCKDLFGSFLKEKREKGKKKEVVSLTKLLYNVSDPLHFDVDPDPNPIPRIHFRE